MLLGFDGALLVAFSSLPFGLGAYCACGFLVSVALPARCGNLLCFFSCFLWLQWSVVYLYCVAGLCSRGARVA